MLKVGFIHSFLLIALGVVMYLITSAGTSLIPSGVGVAMLALTLAAIAPAARMHVMHVLMLLALIGALGGLSMGAMQFGKEELNVRKLVAMFGMGLICASTVFFGVRSFIAARKARKAIVAAANA